MEFEYIEDAGTDNMKIIKIERIKTVYMFIVSGSCPPIFTLSFQENNAKIIIWLKKAGEYLKQIIA